MRIKIIIIVLILIFFSMMTVDAYEHITYVSLVDPNLGFYKVTDSTTHKPAPYEGRVLTINQGDNVIWKNDADPSSSVTIVSNQNLFQDAELKLINDVFSYTFDQPGIYTFYVKEREMAKQTIIVNSEGFVNPDKIPVMTNTPTITTPKITNTPIDTPILNTTDIANTNQTIANSSNITDQVVNNINGNITEKLSMVSIASIIVAIISILMMFSTRRK